MLNKYICKMDASIKCEKRLTKQKYLYTRYDKLIHMLNKYIC